MADVVVLVEHVDDQVKKSTAELLTLARRLGTPVAVWIGAGCGDGARAALGEFGCSEVLIANAPQYVEHGTAPMVDVLAHVVSTRQPVAVLVPSTADGKEIAGRLAVRIESGVITDAVDVSADGVCTQSVFGGSTVVHSRVTHGTPIITVRGNAVSPEPAPTTCSSSTLDVTVGATPVRVVERTHAAKAERPGLTEAAIVVSGGRGVGSPDGFDVIEKLADSLGAAVGASRAATDAGWYPHQFQVGQTGKTVSPQLYVANGISGAIQHRAGMQTSKTIVAVNKDPEAPIFELVDFGVVGDLFSVVPQLTEEIGKRKGA